MSIERNSGSRVWVCASLLCLLGGCNTLSQVPDVDLAKAPEKLAYPQASPSAQALDTAATGSLYSTSTYRPVFEDHRARLVGDSLTIRIQESLSASQASTSTVNRESELAASVSAIPLISATSTLPGKLGAGATTSNTFSGDGTTTSQNTFTGNITATVTDVLPNGHLMVIGEKQIGVNQNVDVLQFSGTVDPRTIQAGNVVSSNQVANVRVLSRGRGAQNDAQTFGWLSRFFLTLMPF